MTDSKAAIRQTLDEVKALLAQEAPPRLSEADTKAYLVEPIIKALGWEGMGTVAREYYVRNSQEFIDYVLKGPNGVVMAIETKSLQADLSDKHAAQLVQYCAVDGIEWAALMNGRELQFFNAFLKHDLAAKRVLRLDLLAFNSDEEFEAIFAQLWQLSRASLTAPSGVRSWMHQRRMDALARQLLTTPDSIAVRALADAMADAEIPATPQDLVQWFRIHLGGGVMSLPPRRDVPPAPPLPHTTPTAPRTPTRSPMGGDRSSDRVPDAEEAVGRLQPLVEAGLLPPGTTLILRRGSMVVARGVVDGVGRIVVDDVAHRSPSDKAFARALGRQSSLNGWREWQAELPGGTVSLDALRQRLAASTGSDVATG
jgi:hypothetical protein